MLELVNCRKTINDGNSLRTLFHIDYLKVDKGKMHLSLGPSGSGKTSLLEVCCGLTLVDQGYVKWCGHTINRVEDFNGQVCYVAVNSGLFNELTITDNMRFILSMKGALSSESDQEILRMLDRVGLSYLDPKEFPAMCSMGEKVRLSLCRALLQRPQLLLLDEPTANLDQDNSQAIFSLIKQQVVDHQMAVLLSSHDSLATQYADHVTRFT